MVSFRSICVASALLAIGCNRDPQSASPAGSAQTRAATTASTAAAGKPSARSPRATDPTPDPITHPCVVKAAQFDVELKKNLTACKEDADCDCFPGGITRNAGCGGVRNKASAKKLHDINAEFGKMECKPVKSCAARECKPKCTDGQCG